MELESDKNRYRIIAERHGDELCVFSQPWWLDVVSAERGKDWDALVIDGKDGEAEMAIAYHTLTRYGIRVVLMAQNTPYTSIWGAKGVEPWRIIPHLKRHFQNEKIRYALMNFEPSLHEELDDMKEIRIGYRPTYIVRNIPSEETLEMLFHPMKRRLLNKARKNLITRFDAVDGNYLYDMLGREMAAEGGKPMYSRELLTGLTNEAIRRKQGTIISVHETLNPDIIHSAMFVPYDRRCGYALTFSTEPQYANNGASTLMTIDAMQRMRTLGIKNFDMEGSIDPGIAKSYSMLGTERISYDYGVMREGLLGMLIEKKIGR
ncbi:MAG: hypothetical protein HUJ96_02775 [Marinilabiliaceae bacterium]|nr:hypothetical protein [Marinilabiliaceae bacterium]